MKKINLLYLLFILLLAGCDNILDKDPLDTFTNDKFWNSENNVEAYANSFYNRFLGYGNSGSLGDFYFKTLSDDQAGREFTNWTYVNVPGSDNNWTNGWKEIRRANIMIEKIPGINAMTEEAKNHWMGVARLMRAWEYYKLVRMYGNVPWIDQSLAITDEGFLYAGRDNRDIIMNKVLEDLDFASSNIRDNNSKITFSRSLAYAMKSEICLYEGTFRKYRKEAEGQPAADPEGAKAFLTESKKASLAIMEKDYSLNPSYQGNYNSVDLSSNPEMILYKAYRKDFFQHSTIAYISSSTQISGMTKDAFDAYLFKDGLPKALTAEDTSDLPVLIVKEGEDENNEKIDIYVFSINDILQTRDKRLEQTIDTAVFYVGRNYNRFPGDMDVASSSGYGVQKYDNGDIPKDYRNTTVKNYTHAPLFWLSVIYLNYAEAAAELATLGGEVITDTDLDKSINLLKARAGLPPLTVNVGFSDPANNHGVSDLIWEIRRERRCELMFDNWFRYWDLIRWHQLDKLDSTINPNAFLGANLTADPDLDTSRVTLVGDYMDASKGMKRTYDSKHYLYPIPSNQISFNPNLSPNNPGW